MQFSPDHFQIIVSAKRGTDRKRLEALAMRRSADISVQQGYSGFRVIGRKFVEHVYVSGDTRGRVRVTYSPGYDDWHNYWKVFRAGAGGRKSARLVWGLADPKHSSFQRDELSFEIQLSTTVGKDVFEAVNFLPRQ